MGFPGRQPSFGGSFHENRAKPIFVCGDAHAAQDREPMAMIRIRNPDPRALTARPLFFGIRVDSNFLQA